MNLIKIRNENGKQLVSARELHCFLEVDSKYLDWFDRMIQYGFEKDVDFTEINELSQKKEGSRLVNREIKNHIITLSMAKELSMLQRNEKGKEARRYFIDKIKLTKIKEKLEEKTDLKYKEYLGVVVFSDGAIISKSGRLSYGSKTSHGYLETYTDKGNIKIHRLVAECFIKNENCLKCINHKNGIKSDNRLENLEWCSHGENEKHAYENGLKIPYWSSKKGARKINLNSIDTMSNWRKIFNKNNIGILDNFFEVSHTKINNFNKKVTYFKITEKGRQFLLELAEGF